MATIDIGKLITARSKARDLAASLKEQRRTIALAAATGDAKAKATLDKIVKDEITARIEHENLAMAVLSAEERSEEEKREFRQREAESRYDEAIKIGAEIVENGRRVDVALAQLLTICETQKDAAKRIAKLGFGTGVGRVMSRMRMGFAIKHAGLREFIDVALTGDIGQATSMEQMARGLVGTLTRPVVEPKPQKLEAA